MAKISEPIRFYGYTFCRSSRVSFSQESGLGGGSELKICPRCSVLIVKMDDGTHLFSCVVHICQYLPGIADPDYFSPDQDPDPDPTTGNYL